MNKLRDKSGIRIIHLAENKEILSAGIFSHFRHRRDKFQPEFIVNVLDGIEAKTGNREVFDPVRIDINHPLYDTRLFGKQVIESGDISILRTLSSGRGFASVVVNGGIVQPIGFLDFSIGLAWKRRRNREADIRIELWEIRPVYVVAIVKRFSICVPVWLRKFVLILVNAIFRLDNISSMIDDNI